MKILHVTCSAQPEQQTGVAQVVHNIIKEQMLRGHEVEVFTLVTHPLRAHQEEDTLIYEGYLVHRVNLLHTLECTNHAYTEQGYNNPDSVPALKKCLKLQKPDIVHFHAIQGMGANMIKVAKRMGCKVVVSMHDWWWLAPCFFLVNSQQVPCEQKKINIEQCSQCISYIREDAKEFLVKRQSYLQSVLLEEVDCIVVVSEYLKSYLVENQIPTDKIQVNKNGVELPSKFGRSEASPIVFGFMGGTMAVKGYQKLIQAFSQVKLTNWELHIYGCVSVNKDGAKKVLNYIKSFRFQELGKKLWQALHTWLKPNKQIKYYPVFKAKDKDEIYKQINVLVSMSQCKESSSLVVREALIRNIPVITTPSGGPQEVVKEGVNGIVLKDNQVESLVEALEQMLNETCYSHIKEKMHAEPYMYSYEEQVEALEKIYNQIECEEGIVCV